MKNTGARQEAQEGISGLILIRLLSAVPQKFLIATVGYQTCLLIHVIP